MRRMLPRSGAVRAWQDEIGGKERGTERGGEREGGGGGEAKCQCRVGQGVGTRGAVTRLRAKPESACMKPRPAWCGNPGRPCSAVRAFAAIHSGRE